MSRLLINLNSANMLSLRFSIVFFIKMYPKQRDRRILPATVKDLHFLSTYVQILYLNIQPRLQCCKRELRHAENKAYYSQESWRCSSKSVLRNRRYVSHLKYPGKNVVRKFDRDKCIHSNETELVIWLPCVSGVINTPNLLIVSIQHATVCKSTLISPN